MKFKEAFMAILKKLGLVDTAKNNALTADNWASINESYQKEHGVTLAEAVRKAKEEDNEAAAVNAEALRIIGSVFSVNEECASSENSGKDGSGEDGSGEGANANTDASSKPNSLIAAVNGLTQTNAQQQATIKDLQKKVADLSKGVIPDNAQDVKPSFNASFTHTDKFAFGIEHPMFSTDHRWNKIAANPAYATLTPLSSVEARKVHNELQDAVAEFSGSLAARYAFLRKNNLLDPKRLAEGVVDFSGLSASNMGNQYVIYRQDHLIARFVTLQQDLYALFPRRYGVQDRDVMTNAFIGDLSSAAQLGRVFKGNVKFEPEMGHVDDAMFKTIFDSMQELERLYLGYMNTDGSDPVKWGMIEWILLLMGEKLIDEQKRRLIRGIYVKPEKDQSGHYLNAGTGLIYTIVRYVHENKLLPFSESSYASYDDTGSTMVDAVKAFVADVKEKVEGLEGKVIYLNNQHRSWWKNGLRSKYGKDTDFTGTNGDFVPDEELDIVWLGGMGQLTLMTIAEPGNFQAVENQPGEMFSLTFQQDMESVIVFSNWKEGFSASYVGRQFSSRSTLEANDYAGQMVFINYPVIAVAPDATTIKASGQSFIFKTSANTAATKLTDIAGAKPGVAYVIEIGSVSNATKIEKTNKFAKITDNFVPTTVGDYLMVVLDAEGKAFREMERCVGGVRSINVETQPNVPGGRK